MLTWEKIPGSPHFIVLQATESWAGSGNKASKVQWFKLQTFNRRNIQQVADSTMDCWKQSVFQSTNLEGTSQLEKPTTYPQHYVMQPEETARHTYTDGEATSLQLTTLLSQHQELCNLRKPCLDSPISSSDHTTTFACTCTCSTGYV